MVGVRENRPKRRNHVSMKSKTGETQRKVIKIIRKNSKSLLIGGEKLLLSHVRRYTNPSLNFFSPGLQS